MVNSTLDRLPTAIRRRKKLFGERAVKALNKPGPVKSKSERLAISKMNTAADIVNMVSKKDDWSVWNVAIQRCGELRKGSEVTQLVSRAFQYNIPLGPDGNAILITALHRCKLHLFIRSWYHRHGFSCNQVVLKLLLLSSLFLRDFTWGSHLCTKLTKNYCIDINRSPVMVYLIVWYPERCWNYFPFLSETDSRESHGYMAAIVRSIEHYRIVNSDVKVLSYSHLFNHVLFCYRRLSLSIAHYTLIVNFFRLLGFPEGVKRIISDTKNINLEIDVVFCLAVCKAASLLKNKTIRSGIVTEFGSRVLSSCSSTNAEVHKAKYYLSGKGFNDRDGCFQAVAMRSSDIVPRRQLQLFLNRKVECPRSWSLLIAICIKRQQYLLAIRIALCLRQCLVSFYNISVSAVLLAAAAVLRSRRLASAVLSLFSFVRKQDLPSLRLKYLHHRK